jgi:aldose 1-epimerase
MRLSLDGTGLSCSFAVHNVGASPAPVGVGFHPYFTVGTAAIDEAEARIPGKGYLEFNDRLTPTGTIIPAAGTEWDYREPSPVGDRRFNHCYVDLERDAQGLSRASLRHPKTGRTIELVMDRSFSAVVVYTGDAIPGAARQALAIEPMTCASDAFNHPEWGLTRLQKD